MPDVLTKDDAMHLVNWPWPAALLAHVPNQSSQSLSGQGGSLLLVSPTAPGLEALEGSGHVLSALWVVLALDPDDPGALMGYRVEEITDWQSTTSDWRQLTVLRSSGDRLFAIEGDNLFVHDSSSSIWKDCGEYKRRSASSEA